MLKSPGELGHWVEMEGGLCPEAYHCWDVYGVRWEESLKLSKRNGLTRWEWDAPLTDQVKWGLRTDHWTWQHGDHWCLLQRWVGTRASSELVQEEMRGKSECQTTLRRSFAIGSILKWVVARHKRGESRQDFLLVGDVAICLGSDGNIQKRGKFWCYKRKENSWSCTLGTQWAPAQRTGQIRGLTEDWASSFIATGKEAETQVGGSVLRDGSRWEFSSDFFCFLSETGSTTLSQNWE